MKPNSARRTRNLGAVAYLAAQSANQNPRHVGVHKNVGRPRRPLRRSELQATVNNFIIAQQAP
jgi:hypothetical protein